MTETQIGIFMGFCLGALITTIIDIIFVWLHCFT
jgi:hypothetical protein